MSLPIRGFGLTFGLGEEATWGTAVARDVWIRGVGSTLERKVLREMAPHLGSYGQPSTGHRYDFQVAEESGGTITTVLSYNDATQMLLRHIFGAVADGGSGPTSYTHTYTAASPPPAGLTLEQIGGTHASLNTAQVFEGCKASAARFIWEAGRPALLETDIIAETAGGFVAAGTPTYSNAGAPVYHHHLSAAKFSYNGKTLDARRATLTIERGLTRNPQLGSLTTAEPLEDRFRASLEIEVLMNDAEPYTAHYAGTQADVTWTFSNSAASMAFTLYNAKIVEVGSPVNTAAGRVQTYRFEGFADATDGPVGLVVTNANSAYDDN